MVTLNYDFGRGNNGIIPLGWDNSFQEFELLRLANIGGGNCFFHAICNSFYIPYRTGMKDNKVISRKQIVTDLRSDLARTLALPSNSEDPNSPTNYDLLGGGEIKRLSESNPEYSLQSLQNLLRSNNDVGLEILEHVSNQLDKDIYLIDAIKKEVYVTGSEEQLHKGRNSIVLWYIPGHYELIGIRDEEGAIITYFLPSHPLISFLQERIRIVKRINQ